MKNKFALMIVAMSMMIGMAANAAPPPPQPGYHHGRPHADPFAVLVASCQRSLQPNMSMSVEPRLHFIIINIRLLGPARSVRPGAIQEKKPGIIQAIRASRELDLYRRTGTTMVYNYVSTDQHVFTIIITPQEL